MASWHHLIALCLLVSSVAASSSVRRELTTRSWDALGFHENIYHSPMEDQIIIGVLDTGIWPESQSFSDDGLGPPPSKWKGVCMTGNSSIPFKCNNKIIGARFYLPKDLPEGDEMSPRDMVGHGTHVSATIAGVPVRNVSGEGGIGLGTARGAVPRARIAVYKMCWTTTCVSNTQAMLDAIRDGVDMISMSNGRKGAFPYELGEAYGTFQAMKAGLLLSMAGGNNKTLEPFTVSNTEPWVITVANSAGSGTEYVTYVTSGDGKRFEGVMMNPVDNGKTMYPLVRIQEVTNTTNANQVDVCDPAYIKPGSVQGKIVLCGWPPADIKSLRCDSLSCAGFIIDGGQNDNYARYKDHVDWSPEVRTTLVAMLRGEDFKYMTEYYERSKSTSQPATASIEKTVSAPDTAPRISRQCSRGPSMSDGNILKPDVSAPGVNQVAAISGSNSPYAARTGTSMSAPFLTGVAVYLKTIHPTWSPAAIKSALMTTATPMTDPYTNMGGLAFGAGEISPIRAMDPGLVYDIGEQDYVKYLCQFANFSNDWMQRFTRGNESYDCTKLSVENGWTLNYPSFAVPVVPNKPFVSVFRRTLTNVANSSNSNYKVIVSAPKELTIKVEPTVLAFTQAGQSLSYILTVSGHLVKSNNTFTSLSASIAWTDGTHQVRSPISVFELVNFEDPYQKIYGMSSKEAFKTVSFV